MNNMGKGVGIIITGIIFSIAGGVIAGASAKKAYDEYKALDKFKEGHIVLNESNKVSIGVESGTINVHHSTTSESYLDYKVYEFYEVKYDQDENEVKLHKKWNYWFVWFDNFTNKSVVDVYLTDKDYDAYFEVSAGKMNIDEEFTFNSLTVNVSAGEFNCNSNINVTNDVMFRVSAGDLSMKGKTIAGKKATMKVSAGDLRINYLEAAEIETRISAGDINCKVKSDKISFNISAGDLDMNIIGDQLDYKTTIKKSAGTCNIKENQSGSKTLDGKISAGTAKIYFVED